MIAAWRESSLRCPVVIEFRPPKSDSPALDPTLVHPENVWRADQIKAASVATGRFYARDLSGSRVLGDESKKRKRALDSIVLGHWSNVFAPNGPAAIPPSEVWGEYEVTPDVVAAAFDAMTPAQRSTFRAVRPTAEVECFGYFDVFNAVDTAFFSMGLCHWTIGLSGTRGTTDAELPPYFAYLKGLGSGPELGAYNAAFGNYGCGVTKEWPKGTTGPSAPAWEPKQRKYTAWVTFESESGTPVEAPRAGNDSAEWFRQWHWCYRFVMAARTLPVFRQRMWDYARIRLRDLLQTPWQPELAVQDHAGTRPATIGDLFTCERSVAMLLRWHVNHPSQLLPITQTSRLSLAFNAAGAAEWGDVNQWTDANEAALCDALFAQRPAYPDVLHCTLDVVYHWPDLATSPSCKKAAEKGDRKQWGWKLDAPSVLNTPRISGLANAGGAAGAAFVHDFTVDLRDVISRSPITASSSDQSIVPDRNITVVAGTPPSFRLSATPVSGASGTTVITVSADNGAHVSKAAVFLTVGGPASSTPPPAPTGTTTGLPTRRHSFLLDTSGLP